MSVAMETGLLNRISGATIKTSGGAHQKVTHRAAHTHASSQQNSSWSVAEGVTTISLSFITDCAEEKWTSLVSTSPVRVFSITMFSGYSKNHNTTRVTIKEVTITIATITKVTITRPTVTSITHTLYKSPSPCQHHSNKHHSLSHTPITSCKFPQLTLTERWAIPSWWRYANPLSSCCTHCPTIFSLADSLSQKYSNTGTPRILPEYRNIIATGI